MSASPYREEQILLKEMRERAKNIIQPENRSGRERFQFRVEYTDWIRRVLSKDGRGSGNL